MALAMVFKGSSSDIPWQVLETPAGKGSKAYNAHSYHTKLSLGICRTLIRNFTYEGELVLDPFAGSGMVGIASLLEKRDSIQIDLSPYATHIARGLTTYVETGTFISLGKKVIQQTREQVRDLLFTNDRESVKPVEISYIIWSEKGSCNNCGNTFILWDVAIQPDGKVAASFKCPDCKIQLNKKRLIRQGSVPVEIVYWGSNKKKQHRISPNKEDINLALDPKEPRKLPPWRPSDAMMHVDPGKPWGVQWRVGYHSNVTHVKDFFSPRNWLILGYLWEAIEKIQDYKYRILLELAFTGTLVNTSRMVRYTPSRGGRSNTPGTLYFPMIWLEQNPLLVYERRIKRIKSHIESLKNYHSNNVDNYVGTASQLNRLEDGSVDFILTDPPFGENIQYAELNFIAEAWLKSFTNIELEAVVNPHRGQKKDHYLTLMRKSLGEAFRVLKPGRYVAFFFNNTNTKLWKELRSLMVGVGFKIIRAIPACKGHRGWNQVRHRETVTAWDPIIFLWKPYHPQQEVFINYEDNNTEKLASAFLRGLIILHSEKPTTPPSYQQWYSQYISAWFEGKIPGDILDIKSFVLEAKKIANEIEIKSIVPKVYSSIDESSKAFIAALTSVNGQLEKVTALSLSQLYEEIIEKIPGGNLARRRRTTGTKRKKRGAFYTPPILVSFTVNETLDSWFLSKINSLKLHISEKKLETITQLIEEIVNVTILDPAVGTGLFLLGARQYLREIVPLTLLSVLQDRNNLEIKITEIIKESGILASDARIIGSCWDNWIVEHALWGVDIDIGALHVAKKVVRDGLKNEGRGPYLLQADSLRLPLHPWHKLPTKQEDQNISWKTWLTTSKSETSLWDIIIGNPPWGIMPPSDGNLDYSICREESALAFLLLAEKNLAMNGVIGFILPSSWLQASSWTRWRQKYFKKLGFQSLLILPEEIFPDATFTASPIVSIFTPNNPNNYLICKKINFISSPKPISQNGRLLDNWKELIDKVEQDILYELDYSSLSNIPKNRVPVARYWWIKRFFKLNSDEKALQFNVDLIPIRKIIKKVVRGVKTGDNKKFIAKYNPEIHFNPLPYDSKNGRLGFDSINPAWVWLAKGGAAIRDGKPIHFIQPFTHVLRWDLESVSIYKKRHGLRNIDYYGKTGIGFPSTGRHSPLFRKVEGMVFDGDYPVIITHSVDDIPYLLGILNSPAILYAAKHLLNHSVHFKTGDLLDLPIPNLSSILKKKLSNISSKIIDNIQSYDLEKEMSCFRMIHEIICSLLEIPCEEKVECESWYINRFPKMKKAFEISHKRNKSSRRGINSS